MTIELQIPDCELDEWLSELKPYQRNTIQQLLVAMPPDEVAKAWIMDSGLQNIVPFGGVNYRVAYRVARRDNTPFWDRFKSEFKKFICDDGAYVSEKTALLTEGPATKALLISAISAAIGTSIGYAAILLAPAVAVLLCIVGKIGINAYCNSG